MAGPAIRDGKAARSLRRETDPARLKEIAEAAQGPGHRVDALRPLGEWRLVSAARRNVSGFISAGPRCSGTSRRSETAVAGKQAMSKEQNWGDAEPVHFARQSRATRHVCKVTYSQDRRLL